jgi:hypothetical protein
MDRRSLSADGVRIEVDTQMQIGALRYCEPVDVEAALHRVTGSAVPEARRGVLCTAEPGGESVLLLWRSPSETLVASASAVPLAALAAQLTSATQACLVEQSGGFWLLRISGARCVDLLVRLGATTSVPRLGESLPGRLAELTVLSACVREHEVLLLVERLYADHLLGWIRETIADF